mgnify:CR=1
MLPFLHYSKSSYTIRLFASRPSRRVLVSPTALLNPGVLETFLTSCALSLRPTSATSPSRLNPGVRETATAGSGSATGADMSAWRLTLMCGWFRSA